MINLSEFPSPVYVSDLIKNVKCAVQQGYFLGKDCEVLNEDPKLDQPEILQNIEKTFNRVIKLPVIDSECIQLEVCLRMYDHLLAYRLRNIDMLDSDRVCIFDPLIEKIHEICNVIPKTGENQVLDIELQDILIKCEQRSFSKDYLQALLTYLVVNHRFMESLREYSHLHLQELFYTKESKTKCSVSEIKTSVTETEITMVAPELIEPEDIDALSEIDLGLGLRFASVIDEDSQGRIVIKTMELSTNEIRKIVRVFSDILKKEEIAPSLKKTVDNMINFTFWRYITLVVSKYRNSSFVRDLKSARSDFDRLFPDSSDGSMNLFNKHWSFENIGICKRIFDQYKSYTGLISQINDRYEVDFNDCFKTKCFLVKHHQLEETYQQIYDIAYKILCVSTKGMSLKQAKVAFSFQKFYTDPLTPLLSPDKFSGKIQSKSEVIPKGVLKKEKKLVEAKAHDPRRNNNTQINHTSVSSSPQFESNASSSKSENSFSSSFNMGLVPTQKSLKFDQRVLVWFADKAAALEDPKYKDLPPIVQEKAVVFHSIGLEVLDLLVESGVKSSWGTRKLPHYSLACEMTIQDHLQKYRGIVTVCFNENNTIYHYGFTDKPANEIVAEYMKKRFWDLDFPALDTANEKPVRLPAKVNPEDGSFLSRKINKHTFELVDQKNKATVLLFIPEESIER